MTLTSIFKQAYTGGTPIALSISAVKNPSSQFDLGTFKISTYVSVSGVYKLVDQGSNTQAVSTQNGTVIKTRDVSASSTIANDQNVVYTFSMKFTYPVPIGGSIKISFTDSAKVGNLSVLGNSCFRLDFSNKPLSLQCFATPSTISITIATPAFTSAGLAAGEEFRVRVTPIINRADMNADSTFVIQSFDSKGNLIDKTPEPSNFILRIDSVGVFGAFTVSIESKVNGMSTTYTLGFAPLI